MSKAQGINIDNMKLIGLALSNAIVAMSGGLLSQYSGFSDVNMGRGGIVFTAIIVAIFLAVPYLKGQSKSSFKKAGKKAAAMAAGSKEGK